MLSPYHMFPKSRKSVILAFIGGGFKATCHSDSLTSGAILRCSTCNVGKMKAVPCDRRSMLAYAGHDVGDQDIIRRKRCDWCATEVLTVEKRVCLLTPPNKDRIKELGRSSQQDTVWRPRD